MRKEHSTTLIGISSAIERDIPKLSNTDTLIADVGAVLEELKKLQVKVQAAALLRKLDNELTIATSRMREAQVKFKTQQELVKKGA